MASGTGARPLPERADERELLGISGIRALSIQVDANKTATFTFSNGDPKDGLLVMSAGATTLTKRGLYIYGCTTTGPIATTAILAPTQSGMSVTDSGRTFKIVNGSSALFVCVLAFQGSLPTVTVT